MDDAMFRAFVAAFILLGNSFTTVRAAPVVAQDCVVCGHQCCCPEKCAPLMAELRTREAALEKCSLPGFQCEIASAPDALISLSDENARALKPRLTFLSRVKPRRLVVSSVILSDATGSRSPGFQDVLIPPPRRST
jgi:hypothetical protein